MKKFLLSCAVVAAALSVQAQANVMVPKATAPFTKLPVDLQLLPVSSDKAANDTYYVDYNALNTSNDYVPGTRYYNYFSVNSQALPIDSLFTEVAVALKPYTGFTDYAAIGASTIEVALGDPGGIIRIDSLFGSFSHVNHSGNENRLVFSLRRGTTYNFTGGGSTITVEGAGNTVVWSDTLKTTTSLSPNNFADGNPAESGYTWFKEVGVSIPVTASSAGLVIQFEALSMGAGDTTNMVVNGNAPSPSDPVSDPYIWNTTTVSSDSPTQIGLYAISANMWAVVTYTNTVSIENLEANGFTMHNFMPNPANESTVISFELKNPSDVRFSIVDMAGKQVKLIDLNNQYAGTQNYVLNTSDMAVGTYSVSMLVNNKTYTQKLNVVK